MKLLANQNSKSARQLRRWSRRIRSIMGDMKVSEIQKEIKQRGGSYPSKALKSELAQILERLRP